VGLGSAQPAPRPVWPTIAWRVADDQSTPCPTPIRIAASGEKRALAPRPGAVYVTGQGRPLRRYPGGGVLSCCGRGARSLGFVTRSPSSQMSQCLQERVMWGSGVAAMGSRGVHGGQGSHADDSGDGEAVPVAIPTPSGVLTRPGVTSDHSANGSLVWSLARPDAARLRLVLGSPLRPWQGCVLASALGTCLR
jgi:hypothetical protein